ncbi:MAG: hypothetical protein OEV78_11620 [Spirochaetia bacterium]|nr:hypothetical protein [Spirochaetia bacterium]
METPIKTQQNPTILPQDERKTSKVNPTSGNEKFTKVDIKKQIISVLDELDDQQLNKVLDFIRGL